MHGDSYRRIAERNTVFPLPPSMTAEPAEIANREQVRSSRQIAMLMAFIGALGGIVIGMLVAVVKGAVQVPLEVSVPLAFGGSLFGYLIGSSLAGVSRHNAGFQRWLLRIATCGLLVVLGTAWGWTFAPYPNWGLYQRWLPRSMLVGALVGLG